MIKKNAKLNPLQSRTLALFQALAQSEESSTLKPATGEIHIAFLPHPHGDHVHVGKFVVSAKDASGFNNEAVWKALERKGLIKSQYPIQAILTKAGQDYDTGLRDQFEQSDH